MTAMLRLFLAALAALGIALSGGTARAGTGDVLINPIIIGGQATGLTGAGSSAICNISGTMAAGGIVYGLSTTDCGIFIPGTALQKNNAAGVPEDYAGSSLAPGVFGNAISGAGAFTGSTLSAINAQTTTYTVTSTDFTSYKTISAASGTFTATLPSTTPTAGTYIFVVNYGTGVVTIARGGSTTINGSATSLTLAAAADAQHPTFARIVSDGGTNYIALVGIASAGSSLALTPNVNTATYNIVSGDVGKLLHMSGTTAAALAVTSTSTASTLGAGFFFYLENCAGGSVTGNCSTASGIAAASNKALVFTPTTSTVDGLSSITLWPGDLRLVVSNGTNWVTKLIRGGYVQVNTADSAFNYTIPTGWSRMIVDIYGAGGPGAGGQSGSSAAATGGGAGGGGAHAQLVLYPGDVPIGTAANLVCTVPAGPAGGAAQGAGTAAAATTLAWNSVTLMTAFAGGAGAYSAATNGGGGGGGGGLTTGGTTVSASGSTGSAGGASIVNGGTHSNSSASGGGGGGSTAEDGGGSVGPGGGGGGAGAAGGGGAGKNGGNAFEAGGGGGGGGGATGSATGQAGGAGGLASRNQTVAAGSGVSGATGITAAAGNPGAAGGYGTGGGGGSGGGAGNTGTAGTGGAGGVPGGGGGGGGAAWNGTGGTGGAGAAGACRFLYVP